MRLLLERVSTRRTGNEYGVFDETTGKCVGTVSFDKVPRASVRPSDPGRIELGPERHDQQHAQGLDPVHGDRSLH